MVNYDVIEVSLRNFVSVTSMRRGFLYKSKTAFQSLSNGPISNMCLNPFVVSGFLPPQVCMQDCNLFEVHMGTKDFKPENGRQDRLLNQPQAGRGSKQIQIQQASMLHLM